MQLIWSKNKSMPFNELLIEVSKIRSFIRDFFLREVPLGIWFPYNFSKKKQRFPYSLSLLIYPSLLIIF